MEIEFIEKRVKEALSEKRFNHSIEVMKRCAELARNIWRRYRKG